MALTVTPVNYYQYGKCDALGDLEGTWTGNSAGTEGDFYKEGAGCLGFTLRTVGQNDIAYTKTSGTWDLSGTKHLRIWFLCTVRNFINIDDPADPANAGIQIFVGDATNTAYFKVSGKTSYLGGWYNLVVDLSRDADSGTKPTGMLCTKIGIRVNIPGPTTPKNVDNTWIDNLIICDGLKLTSDTQFTLQDIYDKDDAATGAWGIVRKISGVYYLTGSLVFGDDSGTLSSDFKDISQLVVFENRKVNSALYSITIVGNSTGVTKFQMGNKSGTEPNVSGIQGCVIKSESTTTPQFAVTCTDGGLADAKYQAKFYGVIFNDAGTITFPLGSTNREVLNCIFESCGAILINTCRIENCSSISANDAGMRITSESHQMKNCNLISCPYGIRFPNAGSYGLSNVRFSGTFTAHIDNTSGGLVTINRSNLTDCTTYTGNTVLKDSIDLTMIVKTEAGVPIQYAWAYIDENDESPFIMNTQTNVNGIATVNYNGSPMTNSRWRVRKYGYKNFKQLINTGSVNIDLPVTLVVDPQQT